MVKIQVRSVLSVAKILSSRKIFVELQDPATLLSLLNKLIELYGQEFYNAVCTSDGYDARQNAILVNGVSAAVISGAETPLKDGDDVLIMPVISGG